MLLAGVIALLTEDRTGNRQRPPDAPSLSPSEDRALIRRLGAEGAVLLKNDGILPLVKTSLDRIAVIGPNAASARVMGGGSAQITNGVTLNTVLSTTIGRDNGNDVSAQLGLNVGF